MKRRSAIKQMVIIAGGVAILPSCSGDPGKASIALKNLPVTADQEALLAAIAETIIPKNDMPGARDMNLHLFTLKMVDDCSDTAEQQAFMAGLDSIDQLAKQKHGNAFLQCSDTQKMELLNDIAGGRQDSKQLTTMMNITKRRVIQGFMNSKYVMTDLKQYELVPGRYNGYFPVKTS